MRTAQRPKIIINRVFAEQRSALEAFGALIIRDMARCSVRTFEVSEQPQYTDDESEVKRYDTDTKANSVIRPAE